MGREIKFRVWDKEDKVMYEPVSIVNRWINGEEQNYDLMQYTGLNDKNGKEIYEGDILQDSLGWVFVVEWDSENARFIGRHTKPRGNTYICYIGREPKAEVIGNAIDNPELLQEIKHE